MLLIHLQQACLIPFIIFRLPNILNTCTIHSRYLYWIILWIYKAFLSSVSSTLYLEKLGGFVGEENIVIDGQQALSFKWKLGLKLEFPAHAAGQSGAPPLKIRMVSLVAGPFELPPDAELASGFYVISISQKPCQPVLLMMEHCANLQNYRDVRHVRFVQASYSQPTRPYIFEYMDKGKFSINSKYGSIQLEHSSLFAIVYKHSRY